MNETFQLNSESSPLHASHAYGLRGILPKKMKEAIVTSPDRLRDKDVTTSVTALVVHVRYAKDWTFDDWARFRRRLHWESAQFEHHHQLLHAFMHSPTCTWTTLWQGARICHCLVHPSLTGIGPEIRMGAFPRYPSCVWHLCETTFVHLKHTTD